MTNDRQFKPIAGVAASDSDIDAFAARRGVPVRAASGQQADQALPPALRKPVHLSIDLPDYLADELRVRAARQRCSVRHLVLQALRAIGHVIDDVDMAPDGRRRR